MKKQDVEQLRRGGIVELKGDNQFALWVKSACCNLSARQLGKLADISDKYGRGLILFSTRQIPIIPFVCLDDVPSARQELAEMNMELDRCGPRVRNLNVCYEPSICQHAVVDCLALGQKLENFFSNPVLHKVKIGVAGCPRDCIAARVLTDIGFIGVGNKNGGAYDAYIGGRLGLNPFIGIKMGEGLSENEPVRLAQNYFSLLERESRPGERAADLINRLGEDTVRSELNRNLTEEAGLSPVECGNRVRQKFAGTVIIRIKATSGEVSSAQARKIAEIAETYGQGFIHFAVRGCPEVPLALKSDLPRVRQALGMAGLALLENGAENAQTCFGGYCTEGLMDSQALLRQIEARAKSLGINEPGITISASGCPNSCGVPQLSDLGFHGVLEPETRPADCTGCGLCVPVCKRKAITIENGVALVDKRRCGYCGQCVAVCPSNGLIEKRRGFAVLVGGRIGENARLRLGQPIAKFLSEDEAFSVAEISLRLIKRKKADMATIIDEVGIEKVKEELLAVVTSLN